MPSEGGERRFRLAGEGRAPLRLVYDLGPKGNAAELRAFSQGLLQIAGRDFERALESGDAAVAGTGRELWASRNKGWLSPRDIAEVNALLQQLSELTSQPKATGRDRLTSLAFVLALLMPSPSAAHREAPIRTRWALPGSLSHKSRCNERQVSRNPRLRMND